MADTADRPVDTAEPSGFAPDHGATPLPRISVESVRGCDLVVDDGGPYRATAPTDAVPMIWGHGLTSSRAAEDEFPLVDLRRVRDERRVIRYDARGHGESGDLESDDQGAWSELARDQVALLDRLGVADVVVGGASMGAATALHAAPLLGDRLRALVLVIPPTAWETRAVQARAYSAMAGVIEDKGVEPLIAASANVAPPDPFVGGAAVYRRRRAEAMRAADRGRLVAAFRGARGADLPPPDDIQTIRVPTLILAWSGDPGHPVETAERLDELLPDARRSTASTMDELATWTDRVTAFLAEL